MAYNQLISIHALVKRATPDMTCRDKQYAISIHALVKRATKSVCGFYVI